MGDECSVYSLGRKKGALTFISGNEPGGTTPGQNAFSPLVRSDGVFEWDDSKHVRDSKSPDHAKKG